MNQMEEQQEEKLPLIIFKYTWNLTNVSRKIIMSNMIQFHGEKIFRVGLKNQNNPSTLLFLTADLAKIGLKVETVLFLSRTPTSFTENVKMSLKAEDDFGKAQRFTAPLKKAVTGDVTYIFKVYVSGVVEDFQARQRDSLINDQLWLSAKNQVGTDFHIVAADKIFPVHKFILVARSPVFAAQFDEERPKSNKQHKFDHIDAACMEQFLIFIYTGELKGSVSPQLKQLATTYQIKTLENICNVAASQEMDRDQLGQSVLMLNPEAGECSIEIKSDPDSEEYFTFDGVVLNFLWKWNQWEEETLIKSSEAFKYNKEQLFRAKARSRLHGTSSMSYYEFVLVLQGFRHYQSGNKVQKVFYTLNNEKHNLHWKNVDEKLSGVDDKLFQMFATNLTSYSNFFPPFSIIFHVKAVNTINNYDFKFVDTKWEEQIWNAAIDRKFTDIEFFVGDQSFAAHRFILSIRSPVFDAMFKSGMAEAQTGQMHIEDVDANTFRAFLEFLYIGTLKSFDGKEQLFSLAQKYQVKTLIPLCQPNSEKIDIDDFTKALLSY